MSHLDDAEEIKEAIKEREDYIEKLRETFGIPDIDTPDLIIWEDSPRSQLKNLTGFERLEMKRELIVHNDPMPHIDYLYGYETIDLPDEIIANLHKISGSITYDPVKKELRSRCQKIVKNRVTNDLVKDLKDCVEGVACAKDLPVPYRTSRIVWDGINQVYRNRIMENKTRDDFLDPFKERQP